MPDLELEIVEGPGVGRRVPIDGPIEIGRDDGLALQLAEDELVSRRHARLTPSSRGAEIEDLGSRNGTFVNNDEIHGPALLTEGDHVLIGVTVFEVKGIGTPATVLRPAPEFTRVRQAVPAKELEAAVAPLAVPPGDPDYVASDLVASTGGGRALDPLLDRRTKAQARIAPLGLFLLVCFAVLVYIAAVR
jgi:hypothetical protein